MPFTVFFAWQGDTSPKFNRWFIERAIKRAVKKVKSEFASAPAAIDLQVEIAPSVEPEISGDPEAGGEADSDIVYVWGARGHAGTPLIAETILQRIRDCGVFIADVTPTTQVETHDERVKKVPNANVLIEIGAASLTGRGWDRMVLVMNTAVASVDELPFDLRHRQCQVTYTLDDWSDPKRPEMAEQLVDMIAAQLRPMYGRSRELGGKDFTHQALVILHVIYISLRQTLIGWEEARALTLDADRIRAWGAAIDSHFAGLCHEIIEELGAQADEQSLSKMLAALLSEIKNVARPFDWGKDKDVEEIAESAERYVAGYEHFVTFAAEHGLRLIPGML